MSAIPNKRWQYLQAFNPFRLYTHLYSFDDLYTSVFRLKPMKVIIISTE